jgi:hypothetical protein
MSADDIVALVGHLAWPATVLLIVIVLRRQARRAVQAMVDRIADRGTDLVVGPGGLELRTNIEAVKARLETLEVTQEQQGNVIVSQVRGSATVAATGVPDELRAMACEYMDIRISNWRDRVRAYSDLSNRMGVYIVKHQVSRDLLAGEEDEGLAVGLAGAVILDPEPADVERLLALSPRIKKLNVRYRLLVAFGRLHERRMLDPEQADRLVVVLDKFRVGADRPLRDRINATASLVKSTAQD